MESAERREYKAKWYLENKDKEEFKQRQKENKKLYREKHKDTEEYKKKNREASKKAREKNRDYYIEYSKNYYLQNKGKWVEYRENGSYNCVYRIIDIEGNIIRIGSTGNGLKIRIANYMSERVVKGWGMHKWFNVFKVDKVEFILTDTRKKAFALESVMIKKYNPLLNQNVVKTDYYDKYIDNLGDISDLEDLWEVWEGLEYYKDKYRNICNKDL